MDALYIEASIFSFSTKADSAVRMFSNFASLSALVFGGTGMVSNRRERTKSPFMFKYTYRFGGKCFWVAVLNRSSPIAAPFEKNISTVIERKNGCLL